MYMAWSESYVYRRAIPTVHDAFSRAIILYYSFTLKITASVLHGLRKHVQELMVSENRWLTLREPPNAHQI